MTASPSLLRRFAAIIYDILLLFGVQIIASALVVLPLGAAPRSAMGAGAFRLYLFGVTFIFFCWFWTHGGQTLGMRAWRLRVVSRKSGASLDWRQATVRFATAILSWLCLGLGFFWMLVDRERFTWHDRLSESKLILLPKHAPGPKAVD